ncbi:MAG: endo-1,4-beta-xylanase [Phycisphaeraceae bacterium]|nr:endo-1,4-beta-xylanase [Phycisphaeraceae bacterium]
MSLKTLFSTFAASVAGLMILCAAARADEPAWKATARERVEKHRMADLQVVVRNAEGQPVPGAEVRVQMTRHAFHFGTTVNGRFLATNPAGTEDGDRYRKTIVELFNYATIENELKWHNWRRDGSDGGQNRRQHGIDAVEWLRSEGLKVRGHAAIWGAWRRTPPDIQRNRENAEYVRDAARKHIREIVSHYRGKLIDWDVHNEPLSERDVERVVGFDEVVRWYHIARAADPDARLFVNEYNIFDRDRRAEAYRDYVARLIDAGAPLDGIGFQGHFWDDRGRDYQHVYDRIEMFAQFDKVLQITEFDNWHRDMSPQHMEAVLWAAFSHPQVDALIMWGFWDGLHWRDKGTLYTRDWELKPAGRIFKELVHERWWTDESRQADEKGIVALRGILGDYEITAIHNGRRAVVKHTLRPDGDPLEIRLAE